MDTPSTAVLLRKREVRNTAGAANVQHTVQLRRLTVVGRRAGFYLRGVPYAYQRCLTAVRVIAKYDQCALSTYSGVDWSGAWLEG